MRLATRMTPDGPRLALVSGTALIDFVEAGGPTDLGEALRAGVDLRALAARLEAGDAPRLAMADATFAPAVPRPGKMLCLGMNYADHAAEGGHKPPDYPAVFMRATTSLAGAGGTLHVPHNSDRLDYEVELAVIIGKRGYRVAQADALDLVFGYTLFNDISVRDYQRRTAQWTMGKNFDGTGILGPVVVTADELPPGAEGLAISSRLGGTVMQSANTSLMIFKVAETVALITDVMTLEPGDVIAMGTPAGVGFAQTPPRWMRGGDEIPIEIEGIGTQATRILPPRG